jgi:hypothetical protein
MKMELTSGMRFQHAQKHTVSTAILTSSDYSVLGIKNRVGIYYSPGQMGTLETTGTRTDWFRSPIYY